MLTVRWWGSYATPSLEPQAGASTFEDGYVLSFFTDMPAPATGGFSKPDLLLGTYVAPMSAVKITPTDHHGWDGHRIFQYEVNLQDTCLDHQTPLTRPEGFYQQPNEVYWLAINAEVGHRIVAVRADPNDPNSPIINWQEIDTGKQADQHFWGWHTSPDHFNDVATMGHLRMPTQEIWDYGDWMPIQPQHGLRDMAFQLLTIPEPSSCLLAVTAGVALFGWRRRR